MPVYIHTHVNIYIYVTYIYMYRYRCRYRYGYRYYNIIQPSTIQHNIKRYETICYILSGCITVGTDIIITTDILVKKSILDYDIDLVKFVDVYRVACRNIA